MNKIYQVKEPQLQLYVDEFTACMKDFDLVEVIHISRTDNPIANALSKLASSGLEAMETLIIMEMMVSPSIGTHVVSNVTTSDLGWTALYVEFLKNGIIPDRVKLAVFKQRAAQFVLLGGILFNKGFATPLLRCVSSPEKEQIMNEVHSGLCGNHDGI